MPSFYKAIKLTGNAGFVYVRSHAAPLSSSMKFRIGNSTLIAVDRI
jgi:hypothetical protein